MKKFLIVGFILLLVLSLFSCTASNQAAQKSPNTGSATANVSIAPNQTADSSASQAIQNSPNSGSTDTNGSASINPDSSPTASQTVQSESPTEKASSIFDTKSFKHFVK
jgi:hypothetical protein